MQLPAIVDREDLKGVRVLLRSSLNVPLEGGVVQSEFRIRRALPTLKYLRKAGARVVLVGHIGREPEESLRPVFDALKKHIEVSWSDASVGEEAKQVVDKMEDGDIVMLENLRRYPEEVANDVGFSKTLASLADMYVNDAFSVSHRRHASIVGVPNYLPGYAGITFVEEYTALTKAMTPESPSLFILGGSKFETKLPLIERYADIYSEVFVGGALANDLFKARGLSVGKSVVSDIDLSGQSIVVNERVLLPIDVTVTNGELRRVTVPEDVHDDEYIYDAGPKTIEMLRARMQDAKTILWNGPLGYYEHGFAEYTKQCAEEVARSSAHSIVGGGDTVAAIELLGLQAEFDFISTAGGAMLVFLETGTLPGIEALQ